MAEFNQLLEQAYNRGIKALLGLDEQEGLNAVAPEIAVVLALLQQPDHAFLLGWRRGGGTGSLGVVGGQVNHVALVNPEGSGVLAVAYIDEVAGSVAADDVFLAMIRDTTLSIPTVVAERAGLDSRQVFVSGGNLVCTVETQQAGTALTPRIAFKIIAAPNQIARRRYGPYVLSPGFGVMVYSVDNAAGQVTRASFEWYERRARPTELQTEG